MSDLDRLSDIFAEGSAIVGRLKAPPAVVAPPPPAPPAPTPSPIPALIRIPGVSHEYATMDPWNLDHEGLILHHANGFVWLHYGDGRPFMVLPGVNHLSEIRWSRTEPTVFYFLSGDEPKRNKLMRFDVAKSWAKAVSVVHEFSEVSRISGLGESDISPDGDSFVFIGDDRWIFTYRLSTGQASKAFEWKSDIDSLYITRSRVLVSSPATGIYSFDHNLNPLLKIAPVPGHMDVCEDQGEEYLIWMNAADDTGPNKLAELEGCRNGVVKIRIRDKKQTCLLADHAIQGAYAYSAHISGVDNKGWVAVSTFKSNPETPLTTNANKILKVRLDGSGFDVLQDLGPGPFHLYSLQPKASVSHDGSRYIYDLNGDSYIGRIA